MRYFFIDLENVRSEGLEGVASLASDDMVFIYYSENAMNLSIPTLENLNNSKASKKFIKTNYIGKNAMDFQIVSLFGAMIERNKQGSYYIISQDNGFRSAVSFCESYFEDYHIICGVAPTIIAAITEDMKKTATAQTPAPKKKHKAKKPANSQNENVQAPQEKAQGEAQQPKKSEPQAQNAFRYIYDALGELLSEKTIDIYAAAIDEAIGGSQNKNDLHDFYKNRFGEDEGEALYKITQGDLEKLKQARPARTQSKKEAQPKKDAQPKTNEQPKKEAQPAADAQPKGNEKADTAENAAPAKKRSRRRHRPKKNHSEEPQTIS